MRENLRVPKHLGNPSDRDYAAKFAERAWGAGGLLQARVRALEPDLLAAASKSRELEAENARVSGYLALALRIMERATALGAVPRFGPAESLGFLAGARRLRNR